ncbi:hypothetical protein KDH_48270 [Dictyobacter sp. S3.2.2.5]|uniref:Heparin-sulfate lyase N-terminal domain-containing protein n=1 Tax=Dictyobacter halimunensis TaxID=3026934 RepID=A0ABQ6FWL8_9CHLR|nr:hypothetical protein KDH_48270 [Dictyobacter sp. S3.2.2.5]
MQLRCDLYWDKVAFKRLIEAMYACCKQYEQTPNSKEDALPLPRWLAEGYWYIATFVPGHTSHPYWSDIIAKEPEYFSKAYDFLDHVARWFFSGRYPWTREAKVWIYYSVLVELNEAN